MLRAATLSEGGIERVVATRQGAALPAEANSSLAATAAEILLGEDAVHGLPLGQFAQLVCQSDSSARATVKAAGGMRRWLSSAPNLFDVFATDAAGSAWSVRRAQPLQAAPPNAPPAAPPLPPAEWLPRAAAAPAKRSKKKNTGVAPPVPLAASPPSHPPAAQPELPPLEPPPALDVDVYDELIGGFWSARVCDLEDTRLLVQPAGREAEWVEVARVHEALTRARTDPHRPTTGAPAASVPTAACLEGRASVEVLCSHPRRRSPSASSSADLVWREAIVEKTRGPYAIVRYAVGGDTDAVDVSAIWPTRRVVSPSARDVPSRASSARTKSPAPPPPAPAARLPAAVRYVKVEVPLSPAEHTWMLSHSTIVDAQLAKAGVLPASCVHPTRATAVLLGASRVCARAKIVLDVLCKAVRSGPPRHSHAIGGGVGGGGGASVDAASLSLPMDRALLMALPRRQLAPALEDARKAFPWILAIELDRERASLELRVPTAHEADAFAIGAHVRTQLRHFAEKADAHASIDAVRGMTAHCGNACGSVEHSRVP